MCEKNKQLTAVFLLSFIFLLSLFVALQKDLTTAYATSIFPDLITTTVNLGTEPPTIDPSKASDTASVTVIEQLFIGLFDIDDNTGDVKPELATSWITSSDGTIYTFTLRSDIIWSDGNPVTAQDVRYGILRTLDPATAANYGYILYIIKNGGPYHWGDVTDPNDVGVTAVNSTTLQITTEQPAAYIPSILSMWVARPLPQWAIDTWGDNWTEPAHIVTNGAYKLAEWVHDDHIRLEKNPDYYDAANVQINRVTMWMTDTESAGQMYMDGRLDTTALWSSVPADIMASDAVKSYPIPCTYYYGFNVTKPPFDNVKVRQAFSAAIDRQGLINSQGVNSSNFPAVTFTPPGLFGHVDGYTADIGLPYDTAQARQLLADAGYPNGQGLPPVTLWYNTNSVHEATAKYVQQSWYSTLGISTTLHSTDWQDYLNRLRNGEFQIWRLGWCMDYPDAYNFLYEAIDSNRTSSNWTNSTYEGLLDQATQTQDTDARKALYKQAEEILVETDAVMIPLYYYAGKLITKPYLDRTYPVGAYDISEWRITIVQETVDQSGGSITSDNGQTTIDFPPDAFTDTVNLTYSPAYETGLDSDLSGTGNTFEISGIYSDTGQVLTTTAISFTIEVSYTAQTARSVNTTDNLGLYYKAGNSWIFEPSSSVNSGNKTITAVTNRLGLWAVLQKNYLVYLPIVLK